MPKLLPVPCHAPGKQRSLGILPGQPAIQRAVMVTPLLLQLLATLLLANQQGLCRRRPAAAVQQCQYCAPQLQNREAGSAGEQRAGSPLAGASPARGGSRGRQARRRGARQPRKPGSRTTEQVRESGEGGRTIMRALYAWPPGPGSTSRCTLPHSSRSSSSASTGRATARRFQAWRAQVGTRPCTPCTWKASKNK